MSVLVRKVSAHRQDHVAVRLVRLFLIPQIIDQIIRLLFYNVTYIWFFFRLIIIITIRVYVTAHDDASLV
jgi:hypothetical protein